MKPHQLEQKKFNIRAPEARDIGAWRIRLSKANRLGADRHCLLRVTHAGRSGYFIGLGHELGDEVVQMDYDVREHLGVGSIGSSSVLKIELIKGWRRVFWYACHRDPYVYVPAYIGLLSLTLGMVGTLMGVFSLLYAFNS